LGDSRTILITGAAGNLGSLLARHLIPCGQPLRLMYHRRPLPDDIAHAPNVTPVQADLGDPPTLSAAVHGADVVVHFAGVLFAPRPERFLPETNTRWLMIDAARWLAKPVISFGSAVFRIGATPEGPVRS
jgi:uncharacterized protein YbjT (DUF2867 family)